MGINASPGDVSRIVSFQLAPGVRDLLLRVPLLVGQVDICNNQYNQKVKVRFYIAQYPVCRTAQSALHFTP